MLTPEQLQAEEAKRVRAPLDVVANGYGTLGNWMWILLNGRWRVMDWGKRSPVHAHWHVTPGYR